MTDDTNAVLAEAAAEFVYGVGHLAELAEQIITADTRRRVELTKTGEHDHRPVPAALLAEVLLGRLGVLRPHLPYVTSESAQDAAERLASHYAGTP